MPRDGVNVAGPSLVEVLDAREGLVCAVGAGGKKSTLYRLLEAHPGRAAFTATVFTTFFPRNLAARSVVAPEPALADAVAREARQAGKLAYACPGNKPGRHAGVGGATILEIHRRCGLDVTLVKADGARTRQLKAPAEDEPVIPRNATTVLLLVSVGAIGQPLDEKVAHRVERVAQVAGLVPGERLQPVHLARVLASPEGLLKGTEGCRVVPVLNRVDDDAALGPARETARLALDLCGRFDRVVLACMRRVSAPVVEVIGR